MLYFQVVILAATVMLAYYCEFTDTFTLAQQGFVCRDPALSKPDPGQEQDSQIQPMILYPVVAGLPVVLISAIELVLFLLQYKSNNLDDQEKAVVMADCCYLNPLVRRTFRFLGVYVFGLFTTDIFVNAGQLVTGSLSPHFLSVCQPNYTALGCEETVRFVSQSDACTGDPDDIMRARKSFPSKEAALSLYAAIYLAMYIMCRAGPSGGRLTRPLLCLSLVSLAVLTGINRVAEYRNHWSDVIAGQATGGAIAVFLVAFVVQYFKMRPLIGQSPSDVGGANTEINHDVETTDKYIITQNPETFTEVT
ncbi:phospholipid phosphatase-related protein type 5-like [Centroberyx affinis]|uniref:phospholipid phosphatase-related protein type 5-like n=1 Tax=Centroberyx affinis TaxID=166261 RepID=UPI003A5BA1C6